MAVINPSPAHIAYMDDLKAALAKHQHLSPQEMLAIASQFVGNLTAMQDQRRYSAGQIMEMVGKNIEIGNAEAIQSLLGNPEGRA
jgi:hypothetical protein